MSASKSRSMDTQLLQWMATQDKLRIERWHHSGTGWLWSVWTALDDEETPSGRSPAMTAALWMAKKAQEAGMAP